MGQDEQSRPQISELPSPFQIAGDVETLVRDTFSEGASADDFILSISNVVQYAERIALTNKTHSDSCHNAACKSGCSYCCFTRIPVTAPEVLSLLQYIYLEFSEDALGKLRENVRTSAGMVGGMSDESRVMAGIPCPLLLDGKCLVYLSRPLECRGYESRDAKACEEALTDYESWHVPIVLERYSVFKNVQAGILSAVVHEGYPCEVLELISALQIALDNPNVSERWFAKEDVFTPASLDLFDPDSQALIPGSIPFEPSVLI